MSPTEDFWESLVYTAFHCYARNWSGTQTPASPFCLNSQAWLKRKIRNNAKNENLQYIPCWTRFEYYFLVFMYSENKKKHEIWNYKIETDLYFCVHIISEEYTCSTWNVFNIQYTKSIMSTIQSLLPDTPFLHYSSIKL